MFLIAASQLPVLYAEVYKSLRIDLPLPTRMVLKFSEILHNPQTAAVTVILLGLLIVITARICNRDTTRRNFQLFALSLPVIGPFLKTILLGRFCRILGILLHRHIPMDAALELTRNCFTYIPMNQAINGVLTRVKNGAAFDEALKSCPLFPPTIIQFVQGGQMHGDLSETLFRLADLFEQRSEIDGARVRFLIYVVAQVAVGVAVGGMIMAFLLPMLRIQGCGFRRK